MYTPVQSSFTVGKWGVGGSHLHGVFKVCPKCWNSGLVEQNLVCQNKVMRYRLSELTSSLTFATLITIGRFRLVGIPVQPIRNHSSSAQSSNPVSADTDKATDQPKMSDTLKKAKEGAMWGMLITDAMSMPVHWYYNPSDIKNGYGGWLTGYNAPEKRHPSSILTLSATDGSGRTGWHEKSKPVIGSVILHDKLKYWTSRDSSIHYHQGMKAGDNTLNSVTALEFLKTLHRVDPDSTKPEKEVRGAVLEDYVKFMTTPGSHNDTYAESWHRSFFKDWAAEDKQLKTAEELLQFTTDRYKRKTREGSDSQLVTIGGLNMAIPWILRNAHKSENECAQETIEFIKCTHPVTGLTPFIDLYSRLLQSVLAGNDLRQEVLKVLSHSELGGPGKRDSVIKLLEKAASYPKGSESRLKAYQRSTQMLGSACYVEGAMSSMLLLAYEFADDFEGGVLANANCGGENCHRGAVLGALLGAAAINQGKGIPQKLKDGLGSSKQDVLKLMNENSAL